MSSITKMAPSSIKFNPEATEFIPKKPFTAQMRLVARIRLETRLFCSMALRKTAPTFNVHATRFHPKSLNGSGSCLNPRAPVFLPRILRARGLAGRRFRFNIYAPEFLPRTSKLNPNAKIFVPKSSTKKSVQWNAQAEAFTPSAKKTKFNVAAKPFVPGKATPSVKKFKFNVSAKPFQSRKSTPAVKKFKFNTAAKPFVSKKSIASKGFVFNVGVGNAPVTGVKTRKIYLDGDAFMIVQDNS